MKAKKANITISQDSNILRYKTTHNFHKIDQCMTDIAKSSSCDDQFCETVVLCHNIYIL